MRPLWTAALTLCVAAVWAGSPPPPAATPNRQPGVDEANSGYARQTGVSSAVQFAEWYPGNSITSPVAFGHHLYLSMITGASTGSIHARDKFSGAADWVFPLGDGELAAGAVVCEVKDERTLVYVVGKASATRWTVYCLWDKGGSYDLLWRSAPDYPLSGYSGLNLQMALLPGGDGRLVCHAIVGGVELGLLGLDTASGLVRFAYPVRMQNLRPVFDAPLRRLYAGASGGGVHCLDAGRGDLIFRTSDDLLGPLSLDPAAHRLYAGREVSGSSGSLVCLDARDGRELWDSAEAAGLLSAGYPAPVLAQGMVVGSGDDGKLFALDAATGALIWRGSHVLRAEENLATGDGIIWTQGEQYGEPWIFSTALATGQKLFQMEYGYNIGKKLGFDRDSLYFEEYFGTMSRFTRAP